MTRWLVAQFFEPLGLAGQRQVASDELHQVTLQVNAFACGPAPQRLMQLLRHVLETYRATMRVQTPEHGSATLMVTRQGSRTWLTLDGSIRITAVLTDQQLGKLRTSADPAPH